MVYTPYLIANFATALDKRLQPWLIPDDAQEQLFDGFVYRGTMSKREGYNYYAIGERGVIPYRESRIVHTPTGIAMSGAINSTNRVFTLAGTTQIARGSITITGSNPAQVLTDDGLGAFTGAGIGTVNYITGAISVTFTTAPVTASTVLITYSFMPGNPVMMVATYVNNVNTKELIVADTQYVNRYVPTTNILQEIVPATTPYTGGKYEFFTWVNYASATSLPRLLFCNNKDVIQSYNGSSIIDYVYQMMTTAASPVAVTTLTCSWMAEMKDRLILLRTTENGVVYPQRIRISGTGANCDDFRTSVPGAGAIDIPDGTWIQGASFNRDDLIIYTEQSTWVMKYTGNDTTPFVLDRIDASRGSDATFAAITYLNRSSAASKRGLIMTDGYRVERQDEELPDFSYNEVDGNFQAGTTFNNFNLCFAGSVDADRDHYLIYPPAGSDFSKRILTTNYDEDNYSIYRLPLSCMGTFLSSFTETWDSLLRFKNWTEFSDSYGNWNSFSFNDGTPFSIGGGHNGEIWRLSVTESEDNPVNIYNITVVDGQTIEVTTDFNNYRLNEPDNPISSPDLSADYIFLSGVVGMGEVNNNQFPITEVVSPNVFRLDVSILGIDATSFQAYSSGGEAVRVIPFEALMKKFNPFVMQDKKVRCGWLYMYVDSTGTSLQQNTRISSITNSFPCIVTTETDTDYENGDQVNFFGIGGMTELNGTQAFVTVITPTSFSLNDVDSTGYGVYTSGGFAGIEVPAKMSIDVITNDMDHDTQLNNLSDNPYQGSMTNMQFDDGTKKWYKVFINQTGKFIQFRLRNRQAGAKVNIQATMPGFAAVGRLI